MTTREVPRRTPTRHRAREGSVLAAVCACTVLVVGLVAAINLAVPGLAASDLHPSSSQLLWIVDAYVVLFACLVIPAGALGDRYGRKGVLVAGLGVFALGALASALATDVPVVLVGRVVSGVGAAAVLPNGLAVLVHATAPEHRARAVTVWAAMSGAGGVVGNVGGGAVLEAGSWRWLFATVVPLALGCAVWIAVVAPRGGHHEHPLDLRSAALLTAATLALLVGIVEGPGHGWGSALVIGAFVLAAVLSAAWTAVGLRSAHPLLDPRLFRIPQLRASCLGMLVAFFGMFGFFYLNASILQYGRGFTVLQAGLGIVPLTVPLLVAGRVVPRVVARFGDRAVLGAAFVVTACGLVGVARAVHLAYPVYAAWLVVIGIGLTLALPTLTIAITAALPREQAGVAGGLQATTRELGSALGVAVIGTMVTAGFSHRLGGVEVTVRDALAAAPARHDAVIAAYTASAQSALTVLAVVVLVAGAVILAELSWARRRSPRPVVTVGPRWMSRVLRVGRPGVGRAGQAVRSRRRTCR